MINFIIKRLLLGILTIVGVVLITFVLVRVIPSNPEAQWVGERASLAELEAARKELGLDKPIIVQFVIYMKNLLKGDFGYSLQTHLPVRDELKSRLPATLELVFFAVFIALLIGIPLGLISAHLKNSWIDHLSRILSIGIVSIPTFWLALLLQLVFFGIMKVLPSGGRLSMEIKIFHEVPHITGFVLLDCLIKGNFIVLKNYLKHLILPSMCVGAYTLGMVARMTRSALLEILGEDYIKAARSYGLPERLILCYYGLKNSLGVVITSVALAMGYAIMNTFLVESIFCWPGIGQYVSNSIVTLNYPAVVGVTIIASISYIFLNFVADIIIALDPRVKL